LPEYFPDICGTGVFHSRVVEALKRERCTGFRAYPMQWDCLEQWVEMMTPKANALEWPVYYRIEIFGRVEDNRSEIDPEGKVFCPLCRMRLPGSRLDMSKNYRVIPIPGTWDGTDLCAWKGDSGAKSPLCSRRVVDLAAQYRWSNSSFGHPTPGVQIIWPIPQNWFEIMEPKVRALHPDQFQ
jgi:hypothetical protein